MVMTTPEGRIYGCELVQWILQTLYAFGDLIRRRDALT